MAPSGGAFFMLRVLRDLPVMFQALLLTCGSSVRHGRDMEQAKTSPENDADPYTLEGAQSGDRLSKEIALRLEMASKRCHEENKELLRPQLDSLEKNLARAKIHGFDRDELYEVLDKGAAIYIGRGYVEDRKARLKDLLRAAPPKDFLELLKYRRGSVICALAEGPSRQEMRRAAERYDGLMSDLEKIAHALPNPPGARGRGKPRNPNNLYALVAFLASQWERVTGQRFSQSWHKGVPLAPGAVFVAEMVKIIDAARLREVPTATKYLVSKTRETASCWTVFADCLSGER
jgi:hypothetical protein